MIARKARYKVRRYPKNPTAIDPARLAAEMAFHMPTKRPEPAPTADDSENPKQRDDHNEF